MVHSTSVLKAKKIHMLSIPTVKGKVKNNICAKKEKEAPWSVQIQRTRRISRVEAASQEMTGLNKAEFIPLRQ